MSMPIGSIGSSLSAAGIEQKAPALGGASPAGGSAGGANFSNQLVDALEQARSLESNATDGAQRFANGDQSVGIHEVMIASEKANVSLHFAVTLKNKVLEAYKDLMNTPV